jgi:hypothetical protein
LEYGDATSETTSAEAESGRRPQIAANARRVRVIIAMGREVRIRKPVRKRRPERLFPEIRK